MMGGRIEAESREGEGSFAVVVPLPLGEPADERRWARRAPRPVGDDRRRHRGQPSRTAGQISAWGMQATTFASATDALALHGRRIEERAVRPGEADYQMPGLDGADLAAAVRGDAQLRDTVYVMLTSVGPHGDRGSVRRAVDAVPGEAGALRPAGARSPRRGPERHQQPGRGRRGRGAVKDREASRRPALTG
jgi:CheY-like chemotaxis protein